MTSVTQLASKMQCPRALLLPTGYVVSERPQKAETRGGKEKKNTVHKEKKAISSSRLFKKKKKQWAHTAVLDNNNFTSSTRAKILIIYKGRCTLL